MDNLFTDTLAKARGDASGDASSQLRQLLEAILETKKKGKIVVALTIDPQDGDDSAVSIDASISVVAPKRARPKSIFFVTSDFGLDRTDPRQAELALERKAAGVPSLEDRRAGVAGNMIAAG